MSRRLAAATKSFARAGTGLGSAQRLPREALRARLKPALAPLRALLERGQRDGAFDPELPADWLIGTLTDLIHAASRQVTAGAMTADTAERALLRTAIAAFTGHRPARHGRAS